MEHRHVKDLFWVVVVLMALILGVINYRSFVKQNKIPMQSKYSKMALSEDLLQQIQQIETSISDRQSFQFLVRKDPLEQNLIVKTMVDLEKEWQAKVNSIMRLSATFVSDGVQWASIEYKGDLKLYKVGDKIENRVITEIADGTLSYTFRGRKGQLKLAPIPEKPAAISENKNAKSYNW
jgi:predicted RND superfamily exporter protein